MVRVLGIVCSPREKGNTEIMVREALSAASGLGAETELALVAGRTIAPCDACDGCRKTGDCRIEDDMQPIYEQMDRADAFIFGTPVYLLNVSAQAKIIMDRTYACLWTPKPRLARKVAAPIVTARRLGAGQVLGLLNSFFSAHEMVTARFAVGYGLRKGEVTDGAGALPGRQALEEARSAGASVVRLAEQLASSRERTPTVDPRGRSCGNPGAR